MAKKTAKKAASRSAAKPAAPKVKASSKVRTKSEIYTSLAEHAGVTRKQVSTMFDALNAMVVADLSKSGSGQFKIPGMFKVTVVRKPATKAREGINPFTKEKTMFKAKPARNVVRARPLKALKDAV